MIAKPKLFLVPAYIGSLKYFARFWPRLQEVYDAEFLFVRGSDQRRVQMVVYAQQQHLPYRILDQGLNRTAWWIPVLTPVWKHLRHIQVCRRFMRQEQPVKIILMKTLPPHDTIVREAARAGVEVIILQWSFHSHDPVLISELKTTPPGFLNYRLIYFKIVTALLWVMDLIFVGAHYLKHYKLPAKIGVFDAAAGEGYAVSYLFPRERITVVGMADSQIVYELVEQLKKSPELGRLWQEKYHLPAANKYILIIAHGFHLRSWTGKKLDYQLAYYDQLSKHLKDVASNAAVMIKPHPSDNPAFYSSLESRGVRVLGDEAKTEELICLADLIVSGIWTSANYLVTASGRPAIFENFTPWPKRNKPMMEHHHIKQVVSDWPLFDRLVREWQRGTLPMQYDEKLIHRNAINQTVELINRPTL